MPMFRRLMPKDQGLFSIEYQVSRKGSKDQRLTIQYLTKQQCNYIAPTIKI